MEKVQMIAEMFFGLFMFGLVFIFLIYFAWIGLGVIVQILKLNK